MHGRHCAGETARRLSAGGMGGRFLGGGTGGGFHGVQSTAVFAVAWVVAGSGALRAFCISTQADRAQHGSGSLLSAAAEPGEGGRTGAYKARFATSTCWEFDALAPDVIADLIRQEIVGIVDQRAWTKAERKEAKARRQLVALAKDWAQ